jgi:predicted metal-binding membrane protein
MFASGQESNQGDPPSVVWQDRGTLLTGSVLVLVSVLAWIEVLRPGGSMAGMSIAPSMVGMQAMSTSHGHAHMLHSASPLSLAGLVGYVVAWGVMMTAMMLPSALPMIAVYGATYRLRASLGDRGAPTVLFTLVYLGVWAAFGVPIYVLSWLIGLAAGTTSAIAAVLPYGLAVSLFAAGIFQFTSLKQACLHKCQHPMLFVMGHWRGGFTGTLRLALDHALYCIGCCWALMLIMVATGTMALHWALLLTAIVFTEKVLPNGAWTARIIGWALILLGVLMAVHPSLDALLRGSML